MILHSHENEAMLFRFLCLWEISWQIEIIKN